MGLSFQMPKIQTLTLDSFIRNPKVPDEIMQIKTNNGNSFTCFPVEKYESGKATLITTRYLQISIDTNVKVATP